MERKHLIEKIDEQINKLQDAKKELQPKEDFSEAEKKYLAEFTKPKEVQKIDGLTEDETIFINNLKNK